MPIVLALLVSIRLLPDTGMAILNGVARLGDCFHGVPRSRYIYSLST
jgi:hypothetical protein